MAMHTHTPPGTRRGGSDTGLPSGRPKNPPVITLPLGNRRQIEDAIEALIDVLDRRDGDPDLEPDAVEVEHLTGFLITAAGRQALEARS